jgi:hypothetical protein
MNVRHAAALALVGWYLMIPPVNAKRQPDDAAPIGSWTIVNSFDKANQCRDEQASMMKEHKNRTIRCIEIDDSLRKHK